MTDIYGIIGYPLTHTFSPAYFFTKFARKKIDAVYNVYPLAHISEFSLLLNTVEGIRGLNVTMPHKQAIIPYLDEVDEVVRAIGAVNCIDFNDGKLTGYNTDVIGFRDSLRPLLTEQHKKALILGTGGASQAVAYVLGNEGIGCTKVSRTKAKNVYTYDELTPEIISEHKLIVNTTSLGMSPNVHSFPQIPYSGITANHLLYDLVYEPDETIFLTLGKQQGALVKNGMDMLILQAEAAWNIWNRR